MIYLCYLFLTLIFLLIIFLSWFNLILTIWPIFEFDWINPHYNQVTSSKLVDGCNVWITDLWPNHPLTFFGLWQFFVSGHIKVNVTYVGRDNTFWPMYVPGCMLSSVRRITVLCPFRINDLMPVILCKKDKQLVTLYNVIFSNMTGILLHLSYIFY